MKGKEKWNWLALMAILSLSSGKSIAQHPASRPYLDPIQYVNPFIGTAKSDVFTRWGSEGGTYPGAVAPWGLVQLSPESRASGGYDYGDSTIFFFTCAHHNSGYPGGSAGQIKIMPLGSLADDSGAAGNSVAGNSLAGNPVAGNPIAGNSVTGNPIAGNPSTSVDKQKILRGRPFLRQTEQASPGYYRVEFSDDHSLVEATASGRVGWFRFTFPPGVRPKIFVGGIGALTRINTLTGTGALPKTGGLTGTGAQTLQGSTLPVVIRYDRKESGMDSVKAGTVLHFSPANEGPTVIVFQVSVSTVSNRSAEKNLEVESNGLSFDQVHEKSEANWRKELSVVGIADSNEEKKTIFYTALYHSLLLPWIISDVEGKYRGRDGNVHQASGKNEYGQFSAWDTFRSLHPLLCLLFPDRQQDMILSLLDIYRQSGHLPTDPMTGNHTVPIIVDSWLKGIRGFDPFLAYTAMKKSLMDPPFLQPDMEAYHRQGYIPSTFPESVTRTVEYAYDDWSLGQFAESVLHRTQEAELLLKRSYNYRNLFNPAELFLLPRERNLFNAQPGTTGYKEGDKWVYSFSVPQHVPDLINLMGGKEAFTTRLDAALSDQSIVFDNETVFHIPYLFNDADRPDRTQYWIRKIMESRFSSAPGGLPGNDDLGAFSSWYVLSAMGLFPVCPGRPEYAVGSPLFREMTLHWSNGKQLVIKARNDTAGASNARAVTLHPAVGSLHPTVGTLNPTAGSASPTAGSPNPTVGSPNPAVGTRNQPAISPAKNGDSLNYYVKSLSLNHKTIVGQLLPHAAILQGGELVFDLSRTPVRGTPANTLAHADTPVFHGQIFPIPVKQVYPNELFWVRFSISNKGALGTKIVNLYANGKLVGHRNCLVSPGETQMDSIACRLYPYGVAELRLEGFPGINIKVIRRSPESVALQSPESATRQSSESMILQSPESSIRNPVEITALSLRPILKQGEQESISFTAKNIGGDTRSFLIPVLLDNALARTDTLLLAPGESKSVSRDLPVQRQGMQTVRVGNLQQQFSVYSRNDNSLVLDLSTPTMPGDSLLPDHSGFDNQGRIIRAASLTPSASARLLLGKDCYVEVPNSLSLDSMGETLTMMAWVYPIAKGPGLVDLFAKGDNHVLQIVGNKSLSFFAGGWGRGDCTVDLPANWIGHWHHIAGVCEGTTLRLYIDGRQQGTATVEGRVNLSNSHKWTLGRNEEFPGERIFHGYMDGIQVFEAPLSGEEIRVIMEKNVPKTTTNMSGM